MKNMIYYKSPIGNLIIMEEENAIIKLCFKEQEITNIKDIQERKDTLSFYLFSLSSSKSFIFISNPPA